MTSPVVLEKSQRIWTYGIAFEPTAKINYDEISWGFQPVIGYRSGIGYNQEIGISLYGIWYPGLVFDHKLNYYKNKNFYLTGDIALYTGIFRPQGIQYDLLFGNRKIYGLTGVKYDNISFSSDAPSWIIGVGTGFDKANRFGLQVTFLNSFPSYNLYHQKETPFRELSFGFKFDFLNTKKKYRNK